MRCIKESAENSSIGNPNYFGDLLPTNQVWRLFPEFRKSTAYLDIETTGLDSWSNTITTIALYDGQFIFTYVQGQNLDDFKEDIKRYKVIVTYNGRCFDVPSRGTISTEVPMHIRWRGLELPSVVICDKATLTATYGKFVAEPFERGFGVTVGNSLRRVLLSSLEGSAVTSLCSDWF